MKMKNWIVFALLLSAGLQALLGMGFHSQKERTEPVRPCTVARCEISDVPETDLVDHFFESFSCMQVSPQVNLSAAAPVRLPGRRCPSSSLNAFPGVQLLHHRYVDRSSLPFIFSSEFLVSRNYLQFLRVLLI